MAEPDPVVAAIDKALADGHAVFHAGHPDFEQRFDLEPTDREALVRMQTFIRTPPDQAYLPLPTQELDFTPDKARVWVSDIIKARRIHASDDRNRAAAKCKIADGERMRAILESFAQLAGRHVPGKMEVDAYRVLRQFADSVRRDGERTLERRPNQTKDAAFIRAAGWLSDSVWKLTASRHDRLVRGFVLAMFEKSITLDTLKRATRRRR